MASINMSCDGDFSVDFLKNASTINRYLYSSFESIVITVVMPCILAVGLIGNTTFLLTVARVNTMRNVTNYYLVNLAVADMFFLAMAVGEKYYRYISIGVPSYGDVFGTTGCVIIYAGVFLPFFASLMTVTIVSLERYYAICKPIQHLVIWKMKYTKRLIASSWTIAIIITATLIPGYVPITFTCIIWPKDEKYNTFPNRVGTCSFIGFNGIDFSKTNIGASVYTNLAQTVPFFFAMTVNTIFYMKIIKHMSSRASRTVTANSSSRVNEARMQLSNQVARMLIATGVVFFFCQAPYQFTCLGQAVQNILKIEPISNNMHYNTYEILLWIGRLLLYINSAINPYIYHLTNSRYKKALLHLNPCASVRSRTMRSPSNEMLTTNIETRESKL